MLARPNGPQTVTNDIPDIELIDASRHGDMAAFGELVTRYQSLACSVAYNQCGDFAASEDFAQEAFLQAWRKLAQLREPGSFKSWLCRIVRNLANREVRHRIDKKPETASPIESAGDVASNQADPAQKILSEEQQHIVWDALSDIPENYREALILFYREEKSVARVAEALEISQDAVKQRLSRGRKMLQEQMISTVENALESSAPSERFASSVLAVLSAGGKSVAAVNSLFWLPLAQLPIVVWLFRVAVDETRSEEERELVIRHQVYYFLGLIPMCILMFLGIYYQDLIPIPASMIPATCMVLYIIPMIIASRRLGTRIEKLREEQNTATPPRDTEINQPTGHTASRHFVLSGLLIALWPTLLFVMQLNWSMVVAAPASAVVLSVLASKLRGKKAGHALRVYAIGLGLIALAMIGMTWMVYAVENGVFWFAACVQAIGATQVILTIRAWRKIYGKES
ncbi:MAG: sigma-70 family RNA polymerase sigma factor [Planctomycetota bacterium]